MKNQEYPEVWSKIENLILREKEEGLLQFLKSDFRAKLDLRFKAGLPNKLPLLLRPRVHAAASAVLLLIIGAGILLIVTGRHLPSSKVTFWSIEKFFAGAPNLQKIQAVETSMLLEKQSASNLESSITKTLSSIQKENMPQEKLLPPRKKEIVRASNLEKKMEVLIKEKEVERFLSIFLKKTEEV